MTTPHRHRRSRRRRLPLILAAAVPLVLIAGWVGYRAVVSAPAGTPQARELAEVSLSGEMTSATVLAVGEATHGTREFRLAWRDIADKVSGRGFTTIVLEENSGCVSLVNEWIQGGPGTAEDAVRRFGFRLSKTQEMVDFVSWMRRHNEGKPERQRIQLYGIDAQRPEADRQVALSWLKTIDAASAAGLGERLGGVNADSAYEPDVTGTLLPAAKELQQRVDASADPTDGNALRAQLSARALVAALTRGQSGSAGFDRDASMAELLGWLVDQRGLVGAKHTLLFAHNGHLDRAGQSSKAPGAKLGVLAAERWGEAYKVIGVDSRVTQLSDSGTTYRFTVNSPLRGIFAGTRVGYLELGQASAENRAVLERSMPMASAGNGFSAPQAWLPFLHEVAVVPSQAWDALIYLEHTEPVTPLP